MSSPQSRFFRSVPLFASLSEAALAEVIAGFHSRVFARNEFLFLQEEEVEAFYVVVAGRVKFFSTSVQGREFTFFIAGARQAFDLPPLFDGKPHPLSASALSDVRVYMTSLGHIREMAERYASLQQMLARQLAQATRSVIKIASDLALTDVTTRLARLLVVSSQTRGRRTAEGIFLSLDLSQSEIAHLLGTAREVVSRSFRALERDGLVERRRQGVLIRDQDKLAMVARM